RTPIRGFQQAHTRVAIPREIGLASAGIDDFCFARRKPDHSDSQRCCIVGYSRPIVPAVDRLPDAALRRAQQPMGRVTRIHGDRAHAPKGVYTEILGFRILYGRWPNLEPTGTASILWHGCLKPLGLLNLLPGPLASPRRNVTQRKTALLKLALLPALYPAG